MPGEVKEKQVLSLPEAVRQLRAMLERQPLVVIAGGIVSGLILIGLIYIPPMNAIQKAKQTWLRMEQERLEARAVIDRIRTSRTPLLPAVDSVSDLISELNNVARAHKVNFLSTTPGPVRPGSVEQLVILPIDLVVESEYRALGEFLGALRHARTLGAVFVRQVSIVRDERLLPRMRVRLAIELALDKGSAL